MKKFVILLIVCVMAFAFTSCDKFEKPTPVLGIVSIENSNYIYSDSLKPLNAEYVLKPHECVQSEAIDTIKQLLELSPFAIVVNGDTDINAAIEAVIPDNIPIVFIGSTPDVNALDKYDKAWYLTANEMQGGEMLGVEIGNAFKNDVIDDQNGDDILQCATIFSANSFALDSVIQSAEDLGVYSEVVELKITDINTIPNIIAEKYSTVIAPELLICETEDLAIAAQAAFTAISQPTIVTFIHKNPAPLVITTPPLFNAAQYPYEDITSACNQFVGNIFKNEAVNNNTDIRLDSHKTSVFSYNLIN